LVEGVAVNVLGDVANLLEIRQRLSNCSSAVSSDAGSCGIFAASPSCSPRHGESDDQEVEVCLAGRPTLVRHAKI
jgi:hypothetical protein